MYGLTCRIELDESLPPRTVVAPKSAPENLKNLWQTGHDHGKWSVIWSDELDVVKLSLDLRIMWEAYVAMTGIKPVDVATN